MADTTATSPAAPATPPAPAAPAEAPATQAPAETAPNLSDEVAKWKALARKNEDAAKRMAALEAASKTDLERVTERAAAAEAEVARLTVASTRAAISAATQVPVDLITGDDEAAMKKAAAAAIAWRDAAVAAATPGQRPRVIDPAALVSGVGDPARAAMTGKERAAAALRSIPGGFA